MSPNRQDLALTGHCGSCRLTKAPDYGRLVSSNMCGPDMPEIVTKLRQELQLIEPVPPGCSSFRSRPVAKCTAFFPGGDGLVKSTPGSAPSFPERGVLMLGSDFGDEESFDSKFQDGRDSYDELNGATWRNLKKSIALAGIATNDIFCTNAWPCLRKGKRSVGGPIPGERDRAFTRRCQSFFLRTLDYMKPRLVVPLGLAPTRFISTIEELGPSPWNQVRSWRDVDVYDPPIWCLQEFAVVPICHPSMPNRWHRRTAKTIEAEAELVRAGSLLRR